jgi:hypothetical protein
MRALALVIGEDPDAVLAPYSQQHGQGFFDAFGYHSGLPLKEPRRRMWFFKQTTTSHAKVGELDREKFLALRTFAIVHVDGWHQPEAPPSSEGGFRPDEAWYAQMADRLQRLRDDETVSLVLYHC